MQQMLISVAFTKHQLQPQPVVKTSTITYAQPITQQQNTNDTKPRPWRRKKENLHNASSPSHYAHMIRSINQQIRIYHHRLLREQSVADPPMSHSMSGRSAKRSKILTNGHAIHSAASIPLSSFHHSLGNRFVAPGLVATDHFVQVPLDYTDPTSDKITIFVRELVAPSRMDIEQPCLLYLQGDPVAHDVTDPGVVVNVDCWVISVTNRIAAAHVLSYAQSHHNPTTSPQVVQVLRVLERPRPVHGSNQH